MHAIMLSGLNIGLRFDEISGMALSSKNFTDFLRIRLLRLGISPEDVAMYTRKSLKRDCVQFYRSLGLRDEQIVEIIQQKGFQAYSNH